MDKDQYNCLWVVSTHSRLKAAGGAVGIVCRYGGVSTHSRLKAAGPLQTIIRLFRLCFNTQPPEGGWGDSGGTTGAPLCFNTQPPEGGWFVMHLPTVREDMFQHTAA